VQDRKKNPTTWVERTRDHAHRFRIAYREPTEEKVASEVAFVKALKRRGRFVIPRATVLTSNRKFRTLSL
jgi:hypothetical protein